MVRTGGWHVPERSEGRGVLEATPITSFWVCHRSAGVRRAALGQAGDPGTDYRLSNGRLLDRQALHAWRLRFTHPGTTEALQIEAPLPADLTAVLSELREYRCR